MQGKVVSNKMNKTVVVAVERLIVHPIYKKRVKRTSRFLAHSESNIAEGEIVELVEIKPMSKLKRFMVKTVLTKEKGKKNDSK